MMSRWVRFPAVLAAALFTACADDGTGPGSTDNADPAASDSQGSPAGFETLLGPYTGALVSESDGVTYAAELAVVFEQSGRSLSGSFSIDGTLSFEELVDGIQGTGSFTGTINRGPDPAVNITFVNQCPGYSAHFAGTFDGDASVLRITGPLHILLRCQIILTFQTTILMDRVVLPEHEAVAVSSESEG